MRQALGKIKRRVAGDAPAAAADDGELNPLAVGFDPATLPWMDKALHGVDEYVASLNGEATGDLRERLLHFMQFGYLVLPGAIEHELIDAYLADVRELFERREHAVKVNVEQVGEQAVRDSTPEQLAGPHVRLMDFHNTSVAGKKLALHPSIVDFLTHVFREKVVAMQSLTFVRGSEQGTHQDFAYVVAPRYPSHLAASWIALEDVHPDAGPLGYYPGSHTLRKFDWGDGLFHQAGVTKRDPVEFAPFLEAEARRMGLKAETFCPKKGDVFFWHGCLAHSGTPVNDPSRTRRSFVTHYSTLSGNPRDRRAIDQEPELIEYNGGVVFKDPVRGDEEDSFTRGAAL
jgi:ectoine hydroxylase-related dioxygenase (phytanoyl-CoA dioxygenase family)